MAARKVSSCPTVFVSFDYENDRRYKFLLEAWHSNPLFKFTFQDGSSGEINSFNVGRIKAGLTAKINTATHTLVIVGRYANLPHRNRSLIGSKNWINFEIKQSKANRNKLVAVKLDRSYEPPDELIGSSAAWTMSFNEAAIIEALRRA
jgi:hypothetical protein